MKRDEVQVKKQRKYLIILAYILQNFSNSVPVLGVWKKFGAKLVDRIWNTSKTVKL